MAKKINPLPVLSRRERQILDVLFRRKQATAQEIQADIPDAPGNSAIRALLRILEDKGHVHHREDGPRYIYVPVVAPAEASRSALRHVLDTFFEGSAAGAMAALIPPAFGVTVITWLLVFFLSRYVSMASIAAALILPVATIFTVSGPTRWPLVAFTSALAALAVWRHRANIERLKAGTEHRINKSKLSAS